MRVVKWLTGLLYQLSLFITRSWEVHFHPRQEALVRTLASYEVVTPARVNEFGEVFPQSHHFSRRKRSSETLEPTPFRTHYRIRAYGQLFQLNLSADAAFLAAGYTEVHLGTSAHPAEERSAAPPDLRHCFYRGQVNAREDHTAVFSLCGGLMGTFKAHDGEYFLEPIMKADGSEHEDDHNKPHLIYRQELKRNYFLQSHKPCDVSESEIKKTTLPFHNYSDVNENLNIKEERVLGYTSKNISLEDERSQLHSRKKRFLSYPRYVEVMVTADSKMVHHHGQNLQHYVLTLMSIVAAIYKDSSIGNLINIVIVKLVIIHDEQEGPVISFNAATTLRNFCLWQQTQNVLDDAHPSHHDTAVLITREDICGAREKCDTLGLAELGTLCDPLRSCSISEENGLSAAFTIAHELGHVFNVPHDDSFKCKETGIKHQYHVMAPTLNYHTSPWTWSKCSQKYITEFLDTGHGECLLDKPNGRIYDLSSQLPGLMYDVNKQCELMFGPGSQVCPYLKQCRRLWCTSAEGVHKGCRTQHMPLADGTNCGPGMHCHHGLCVNKEMETRPVDGDWGPWGPYSSCSRTCGGGIKSTSRLCNRPEPRNGGKYCVGRRMKFRSCNTDSCPKGKQDFREKQCSDFDGKHFNINGLSPNVRWLPKYSGIAVKDRCKLYCRVAGTTSFYQLKDRVADGTPCGTETNDICVQGLCRQAGCDHVLNSKARRDKCGVCGGDNSSCRTMAGVFNSAHYGYNVVVKIPPGATNIDILQHSYSGKPEDDNYLALSDTQGNFLLNGNFVVSMSKREINVQGAIFEYSGSNNSIERINSTDRLEEELVLQVLCVGNLYNPDVRYSFNIPVEEKSDLFTWDPYGPWQDCTKMCQGLHRRKITCVRKSDHMVMSDQSCDHIPLPLLVTERCNTDCELRWHIIGKSECSALCGQGYKSLDVHCMKYSIHNGQTVPVVDHYCSDQLKPPTREPCHGDCVLTRWHYLEWSQCSRSCGGGERSRDSYCINNFGHRLADRECQELPRVTVENCNEFSCPSWATSEWSECLVTCGKGTNQRQVWCQLNEDHLSDGFCDPSTKPESQRPCELHACTSWQVGPWGSCTATCGQGYQMRAVKCVNELFSAVLDDRLCHGASRPSERQDCIVIPCPVIPKIGATSLPAVPMRKITQWRYGSWTPCSVSCGRGNQARYVSCRDAHDGIADESFCAHLPRPAEIAVCFSPCGEWQTGNWSPCSASCGRGKMTRQVLCINYHQPVNENYCDPEVRPVIEQECNLAACPPTYSHFPSSSEQPSHFPGRNFPLTHKPEDNQNQGIHPSIRENQWRTGPWGSCSRSCAGGVQRRVVVCQDENGQSASYCDSASKPPESKHCDSGPCPQWNYGSWGECTQTCGGGIKSRFVICQFPNGQLSQEQNCEMLNKPPSVVQCHIRACPDDVSWHRGPWKSCSASCGKGLKYREVLCIDQFHGKLEEKYCSHLRKPRTHKACRSVQCPSWKANRWKECSVTCGSGVQQRDVYCRLRGVGRVAEEKCDPSTRPYFQRECWHRNCTQYHWVAGEWLDCSISCKKRETYRQVKCVNAQNIGVSESFCDLATRPLAIKKCRNSPCKYIVITGDSSQCAGNCGFSYRQRITYCIGVQSMEKHKLHELWPIDYRVCPVLPSPQVYKCNFKTCLDMATWKVGKWSKCSVTCGVGMMERRVECMADNGLSSDLCLKHLKPDAQKKCYVSDCKTFTSCKEIQMKNNITKDGDYYLNIKGRITKIYCAGMHLQNPKEYISLVKGEEDNFSEVYGFRLRNPYECPFNGSRRQDCECKNDYMAAGHTVFSKIRIDLTSMQIKTTDLLFAQTIFGNAVPFATAGDCYSAARCPQGQFSINLAGTGMKISSTAKWLAQGSYASVIIHRSQDGTKVYGRCGGFCGKCIPHMTTGLPIQVV
ncbi:A disintegrin and metalloproteinase with thrombospondin motifs 20 [Bos mutus]|uniref:A disintegrin and metalloproteinase with thrombospondin motifs 20 n=1 Tax=Bos mutus TaxID=72004 RepID=L8IJC0_9CETA|nr:PREDICTED: A disintegrin and metalloproteinase with thrombospondin motifs 20 [Bos mutus]ELR55619.1 A disintegrin and metalloproteinase with thrombospondin motifs 20 [Bos mutus]